MFIDTHCHLSREYYDDISSVLDANKNNNVLKIIISGCSRESIIESLEISKNFNDIFVAIGYHPSEANIVTNDDIEKLKCQLRDSKVVALGEIGLDYYYGKEDKEKQVELFEKQLKIAEEMHLPVVIHSRDAAFDTLNSLKKFNVVGVIHCFSYSKEVAREFIKIGFKLGIGGVITFKKSKLFEIVEEVGINNIVLETDSPYLTPEPYRGTINSSKYIPIIANKIADVCKISLSEVEKITTENAYEIFDLK